MTSKDLLLITAWYPTPEYPLKYPFIRDHLDAMTKYFFQNQSFPLRVLHLQESMSVFKSIRHWKRPYNSLENQEKWVVRHLQPWRISRRWSVADIEREKTFLCRGYRDFAGYPASPRVIISQTLTAARYALQLKKTMKWDSRIILIEHSGPFEMQLRNKSVRPFQLEALENCDHIVAVSENLKESIKQYVKSKEIHVINNPVDERFFKIPLPKQAGKTIKLVTVGFSDANKNHITAIRTIEKLINEGIATELYIIGTGPETDILKNYVNKHNLNMFIHFTGSLNRDEILQYLPNMHGFILPSLNENCPVALQEAISAGLPSIVLKNGASELLMEPDDGEVVNENNPEMFANSIKNIFLSNQNHFDPLLRRLNAEKKWSPKIYSSRLKNICTLNPVSIG